MNRGALRILFVVHGLPPEFTGGTELYALRAARALTARGHQVDLVCGSSEARDPTERQMLGEAPIIERIRQTAPGDSKQVIDALVELAASWSDGQPQHDDITLVVIKRKIP